MKIIDAHCHIHKPRWNIPGQEEKDVFSRYQNESGDENQILANMAEAGVEQTIIFPYASILINLEVANHYTAAVSRRYPDKFIPFTVIDNKPGYWRANGVKGFKEHVYGQRILRDGKGGERFSQDFKETYAYMEEHRVPLLLHAGTNRVQRLQEDIFKDTPDLLVILAHLGADFPEANNHRPRIEQVKNTLTFLKGYPTLYFDISAITDADILQAGLEIVGSEKLIFGSDFPFAKPIDTLGLLKSLKGLSARDLENILYNNIIKLLQFQE
jgi:predicted TIM-barrel fold metal-dependent hydrolase